MRSKRNIRCSILLSTLVIVNLFFINISLAANTAKVNVETANLREKPDVSSKIYEQLSINDEVEILEKTGEWYKVKSKNITGYLRQDLLTVEEVVEEPVTNDNNVDNKENENTEDKQENKSVELGIKKVCEDTKLKIVPVINGTDIIEVKKDEQVNVIEVINGWACVETKTTKGWIRLEKLLDEEAKQEDVEEQKEETDKTEIEEKVQETVTKTKYIKSTTVNLRREASTNSEIITTLSLNTTVEVMLEENGWSKVKVEGKEGYISSSLLSDNKQETSRSMEASRKETEKTTETKVEQEQETTKKEETQTPTVSTNGIEVVAKAKQYIGSRYVYGGVSPSGFDCSGFTSYIYKQFGVNLNRTAAAQYSNGTSVSKSNLQVGDLVMFGKSGINHVGIYIGGGQMVHAANPSRGVTTDTINSGYYYNNYVGARRVIK